jgi:glycosyltransferase involved in cell wall biosynthesis
MRILFFSHYFPPEVNAPANRTHEHCREWAAAGHEVHVITCTPSHPHGRPFAGYEASSFRRLFRGVPRPYERIDGIHVHRVWTWLAPNRGVAWRVLNFLSFVPGALLRARRLGRFDVAVGTSPQFFCAVAAWLYARLRRTPWVFELRDLWPESIPAVGAMRRSRVLALLERLELRMYRDASAVACVTRAFAENLASRGIDRRRLHFVPNGIVPAFWRQGSREEGRAALGAADGEILVGYVGTIGMAHGLRTTLEAAAVLRDTHAHVKFVIVGDGAELPDLRAVAAAQGLTNVRFTGLLPRDRMPSVLAAIDIALVTLRPSDVFRTVLPSKMFEAMAAGRPVVLAVDGEARATLERARAGVAVTPGHLGAFVSAIERLSRDAVERARMGEAGTAFVAAEFSRRVWAARYLDLLSSVRVDGRAETGSSGRVVAPARSRA